MRIRTKVLFVFLCFTVLPLLVLVLMSYANSMAAVRSARQGEAARLAGEMEERMSAFRKDFERRFARLATESGRSIGSANEFSPELMRFASEIAELEPYVETLEWSPVIAGKAAHGPVEGDQSAPSPPPAPLLLDESVFLIEPQRLVAEIESASSGLDDRGEELKLDISLAGLAGLLSEEGRLLKIDILAREGEVDAEELATLRSELEASRAALRNKTHVLFGREIEVGLRHGDTLLGTLRPRVRTDEVISSILRSSRRQSDEIAFAVDVEGVLYTADPEDDRRARELGLDRFGSKSAETIADDWVLATDRDPSTGLIFGIARPIGESLAEIRAAAASNLSWGFGVIGLALLGIVPLSNRFSKRIESLTVGAEMIARGDLTTRVPIPSTDEIGTLAAAFNRMAEDLSRQQEALVGQERAGREREVQQRLLEAEVERQADELESARQFQMSMLPRSLPRIEGLELAVAMRTASEVGGDYYDFHIDDEGSLTAAIGDATGHGARAGTMVAIVKSQFSAWAGTKQPAELLAQANRSVRRMELGRMAMALAVLSYREGQIVLSSAGMPPAWKLGAEGSIEEILSPGVPLGAMDASYEDLELKLEAGDCLVLMSDGLPELRCVDGGGELGEPYGYERTRELLASAPRSSAQALTDRLMAELDELCGDTPPDDDVTFVVLRRT